MDPDIQAVIDKLKLQYEEALEVRRRADARASQCQAAIAALEAASSGEPLVFNGTLADACRVVLKSATKPMAPTEVRDGVVSLGFQLSSILHSNPMASIHSVLKRFVDSDDAEQQMTKAGAVYRWTGLAQAKRAAATLASFDVIWTAKQTPLQGALALALKDGTMITQAVEALIGRNSQILKQAAELAKLPEATRMTTEALSALSALSKKK